MKNERGIASILTIIIMLMMAGVSINMVSGTNGVLTTVQKNPAVTNSSTAKANSTKGTANDALSTALSSLSTDYYANGGSDELIDTLTEEALEENMPGYDDFSVTKSGDTATITFSDSYGNEFEAEVSDTLTISSFEME